MIPYLRSYASVFDVRECNQRFTVAKLQALTISDEESQERNNGRNLSTRTTISIMLNRDPFYIRLIGSVIHPQTAVVESVQHKFLSSKIKSNLTKRRKNKQ